ncbi:MAG: alpha/beta hydrolase [Candidatus Omnitrophota bacterium]
MKEGLNTFLISMTDVNGRRRLVSYSIYSEPVGPGAGGGSLVERPVVTVDMTAEGYTPPRTKKKLSTRTERRMENPPAPVKNNNLDVAFSSPYSGQVITEKELKIGGRFNLNAGITSITVNGQPCTLNKSAGTFEGPMLICPGKAREYEVNTDSPKYILMMVDPNTHSGENILKVKITLDTGKTYEDRVVYYYYQLFVYLYSENEIWLAIWGTNPLTGQYCILRYEPAVFEKTEGFNSNLFYESPYGGWMDMKYNTRTWYPDSFAEQTICNFPNYYYEYKEKGKYVKVNYPYAMHILMYNWGLCGGDGSKVKYSTKMYLHSPPKSVKKYVVIFENYQLLETDNSYKFDSRWWNVPLNINNYIANGLAMNYLAGSKGKEKYAPFGETTSYIILDNNIPDTDFELSVETPNYGDGFWWDMGTCDQSYISELEYGISGDILVDSNNDGFLGGEDNAVEQNEPGCVFWVNDDDDSSESTVHQDDLDAANDEFDKDYEDDAINGIRDLEDLMPFNITIPNIKEWTNNQNIKFYLKAEGQGKIRVFKRINDAYLAELRYSKKQFTEKMKFTLTSDSDNKGEGQLLDPSWFDSDGNFYGVFEGVNEGSLKLTLEVELGMDDSKKRVVLDEAVIALKDVRDMYRFINVREGPTVSNTDNKLRYRDINVEKSNMVMDDPSSVTFFIHGASTPEEDAIEWSGIVYKRLYRTGHRGGFIGLSWHSDENVKFINPKTVFDNQWVNSFQTGQVLADVIINTKKEFKDAKINLIAHSLGGNLTSYALRLLAAQGQKELVNDVFLIQVAVPGNAYGGFVDGDYFKDMYFLSAGNSITGKMYNLFYSKDKLLDEFRKDISGASYSTFIGKAGLPIPLNNCYELLPANEMQSFLDLNAYRYEKSKSGALGRQGIRSDLPNFESYYRKFKTARPYGIRDHLSFGTEYYYDVKEYYGDIINPESMGK